MPRRESARIVIVGGGVIGLGVAFHLGRLGFDDVLLVEHNQLTSGTSWHAAGIVGRGTPPSELLGEGYEIGVAGDRFPLRALPRPAYDPRGARLRS